MQIDLEQVRPWAILHGQVFETHQLDGTRLHGHSDRHFLLPLEWSKRHGSRHELRVRHLCRHSDIAEHLLRGVCQEMVQGPRRHA